MRDSNAIEGEFDYTSLWVGPRPPCAKRSGALNIHDMSAAETFLKLKKISLKDVLAAHERMFGHRMKDAGCLRLYNVRVGSYTAPDWKDVKDMMKEYIKGYQLAINDSWDAHNRFEKIHPFGDGNGRMGRLLWLRKAIKEGYDFSIPFLQMYYYQTLQHVN